MFGKLEIIPLWNYVSWQEPIMNHLSDIIEDPKVELLTDEGAYTFLIS